MTQATAKPMKASHMLSNNPAWRLVMAELLKGMGITIRYFFKPKVTINYPYEKRSDQSALQG